MTIVEKIINSIKASQAEGFEVYYHDDQTLNLMTSTMTFPCAIFRLLTQGRVVQEGGQVKERVSAAVFFVEPTAFDFDAVANEAIIARCKDRAAAWQLSLSSDPLLTLVEVSRSERLYDPYDDHFTGFGILADLVEINGIC